ncbi:MAG: amidohydrolase family protein, partial [Dehalococcoidia bacterium]|nr:amidohydrolase family protein [Dehalococcoidia bacterium]
MKLLVDRATVITLDSQRRIIKDGAIAIDGNRIVRVGKSAEVRKGFRAEKVIDAGGKVVLPGLIDAHCHVVLTLSRGFGDDVDFFTWLYERSYPFQAVMTEEEAYVSTLLGCLEMMKTGTTCFAEPGIFLAEGAVKAVGESGLRAVLAKRYMDTVVDPKNPQPQRLMASKEEAVERHREFFKRFHGAAGGRIRVWIGMGDPRGNSAGLLKALKELADGYGTGAEIHVAAAVQGVEFVRGRQGLTDVEYLNSLGLLGPNMLLIHSSWLSDAEVELVKKHNVKVCHCPG